MSVPPAWPQVLDFFGMPLVIEPSPGQLSGGAGLLPIRQFDQRIGLTRALAEALDDLRDPDLTEHTLRQRHFRLRRQREAHRGPRPAQQGGNQRAQEPRHAVDQGRHGRPGRILLKEPALLGAPPQRGRSACEVAWSVWPGFS